MSTLKLHKVTTMPAVPEPSSLYLESADGGEVNYYAHKAWRFYATQTNGNRVSLTDVSLPTGGTAFASSAFDGSTVAANAFDSNDATYWSSAVNDHLTGCWVGKFYTTPVIISAIDLESGPINNYTPTDFDIQYSDDTTDGHDGTWYTMHNVQSQTWWGHNTTRHYTFNQSFSMTHRGWRITTVDWHVSGIVIAEIKFNGSDASGVIFASNEESGYGKENAFDNNGGTIWASYVREASIGKYWASPQEVTSIEVVARDNEGSAPSFPTHYQIQYSDDTTTGLDGTWRILSTTYDGTNKANSHTDTHTPAITQITTKERLSIGKHKAWRLYIEASGANGYHQLSELQFGGTSGGTIFASTTWAGGGYESDKAFDGMTSTEWASLDSPDHAWIGMLYSSAVGVNSVTITAKSTEASASPPHANSAPHRFFVQYSDDTTTGNDGTWVTAARYTNEALWGDSESRTFTVNELPTKHTCWRLNILDSNGHANCGLSELVFTNTGSDGTTYASSVLPNDGSGPYQSTRSTDRDSTTRWAMDGTTSGQIGRIYGTTVSINGLEITHIDNTEGWAPSVAPKDFTVEYSDNSTNIVDGDWYNYMSVYGQTTWGVSETRSFFGPQLPVVIPTAELVIHATNSNDTTVHTFANKATVLTAQAEVIAESDHIVEVADITARDALVLTRDVNVRVVDATDDVNVPAGGATYFYSLSADTFTQFNPVGTSSELTLEEW